MDWKEWKKRLRSPQELAHWVESIEPRLAKYVLSYASHLADRNLLGASFQMMEWSDERVGLRLGRGPRGLGSIVTLSEFMLRALLGRHLPLADEDMLFTAAEVRLTGTPSHVATLKMELRATDREAWILAARQAPSAPLEVPVRLWTEAEQSVGEVALTCQLRLSLALPGPT